MEQKDTLTTLLTNSQILQHVFQKVDGSQDFHDVTLATEDVERAQAHKLILSEVSMASDTDDEPSTMEELLRIFQVASKRGENVSLTLVSRDSNVTANFKLNSSTKTGKPAPKTIPSKRKLSPSQLRRNQNRMAAFIQKKEEMKKQKTTESVENLDVATNTKKSAIEEVSVVEEPASESSTTEDKTFKCDQCDSDFPSQIELNRHTIRQHKVTLSPIPQNDGLMDSLSPDSKRTEQQKGEKYLENLEKYLEDKEPKNHRTKVPIGYNFLGDLTSSDWD